MSYVAPLDDIRFALNAVAGLGSDIEAGAYGELDTDLVDAILVEAGKFAGQELASLDRIGDMQGARLVDGQVQTAAGWKEAYSAWVDAGWPSLSGPEAFGGQGLPAPLALAVCEMWNSACMAFALGPLLTMGATEALQAHGSDGLKADYLENLVSGRWTATMNLTEPQAGSDLSAVKTRAQRQDDGSYRLFGTKIFITYGDHDMTDNVVHLVLARLPDAPAGTRGISLFLAPKYMQAADGSWSERNDISVAGLEHKLGIHASPTCVMSYGENDGAVAYLVGEENRGLACMFTMMNSARLNVGVQGVAIAERAYQRALAYAAERRQGRAAGADGDMAPIIMHPDIRRMLADMRAKIQAARAICYVTAAALDQEARGDGYARFVADLLTPIAKAYSTDIGVEVSSTAIQVHGGMGYIEETGAAQHFRDARIAPIYEGTNGIQALDLVSRKLRADGGRPVREYIGALRSQVDGLAQRNDADLGGADLGNVSRKLLESLDALEQTTEFMLNARDPSEAEEVMAGATPYLRQFALTVGAIFISVAAWAGEHAEQRRLAQHFCDNLLTETKGLASSITEGAPAILALRFDS